METPNRFHLPKIPLSPTQKLQFGALSRDQRTEDAKRAMRKFSYSKVDSSATPIEEENAKKVKAYSPDTMTMATKPSYNPNVTGDSKAFALFTPAPKGFDRVSIGKPLKIDHYNITFSQYSKLNPRTIVPTGKTSKEMMLKNEIKIMKLKQMLNRQQRKRELKEWAIKDYGVDVFTDDEDIQRSIELKHEPRANVSIENEADFIFKVRNQYCWKKHSEAALKIQTWIRMQMMHNQYKKARDKIISSIKKIQHFMRMYWFKQLFMKNLQVTKQRSTFLI